MKIALRKTTRGSAAVLRDDSATEDLALKMLKDQTWV
jgi:hypothetical protein